MMGSDNPLGLPCDILNNWQNNRFSKVTEIILRQGNKINKKSLDGELNDGFIEGVSLGVRDGVPEGVPLGVPDGVLLGPPDGVLEGVPLGVPDGVPEG